jgi:glycosyltransferase involved in cell wall biosynthesis
MQRQEAVMQTPEVSVVIPTHNRRMLLPRMLGCALDQRGVELEVVVVDDGSSDGTWESLQAHADPRVRPVRNDPARGEAGARNRGIEEARAPWVAFADDDDLWSPDKLAAQLEAAHRAPGTGWVCTGSVEVDAALEVLGWEACPTRDEEPQILARNVITGGGSGVMARTDLVREVGGFDGALRLGADRDLWIRLWLREPLATVDRPLVAHVVHGASISARGGGRQESFAHLAAKYAAERERFGVDLDVGVLSNYADALILGGARRDGIGLYAHGARQYGEPRLWAKAMVATLAPALLRRRWRRKGQQWADSLPQAWQIELDAWLAAHRKTAGSVAPSGTAAPGDTPLVWNGAGRSQMASGSHGRDETRGRRT